MHRTHLSILSISLFVAISSTQCMMKLFEHQDPFRLNGRPIVQTSPAVKQKRLFIGSIFLNPIFIGSLIADKTVSHIRQATDAEAHQECLGFALAQLTGFKGKSIEGFNPFIYFKETRNPRPNDLVIYATKEDPFFPSHYGIWIAQDKILSKWGTSPYIVESKLFDQPPQYGNYACIVTLKEEYSRLPKECFNNIIEYNNIQAKGHYLKAFISQLIFYYRNIASLSAESTHKFIQKYDETSFH